MTDRITIRCPKCQAQLKLKDRKAVGKKVPCPKCRLPFLVEAPEDGLASTVVDEFDLEEEAAAQTVSKTAKRSKRAEPTQPETSRRPGMKPGHSKKSLVVFAGVMGAALLIGLAITALQPAAPPSTPLPIASREEPQEDAAAEPAAPAAETAAPEATASADATAQLPAESTAVAAADVAASPETAPAVTPSSPPVQPVAELPQATIPINNPRQPAASPPVAPMAVASDSVATALPATELAALQPGEVPASHIGHQIPPFSGTAVDNTTYQSSGRSERVLVVAFMGVECPLANLYFPRMAQLQQEFQDKSVAFVAVNSNAQDVLQDVQSQAKEYKLAFPVLKDAGGDIAATFAATRTPEVFVLDEQRVVRYHGMFDDQYGYQYRRAEPTQNLVADAVEALLAGQTPQTQEVALQGCVIGRSRAANGAATTSFYRDVLPILQERCQTCHREGNIGPFVLAEYAEVSSWAETIKEAVVEHRMPPWKADPQYGEFTNDMSLSEPELQTLVTWVDEGAPEGNVADKPAPKEWTKDWNIGEPDQVFQIAKAESVPATGIVPYRHVVISEPFKRDRWVQAMECKMGNPSVVHHILALLRYPNSPERDQDGLTKGFFAGAAPGSNYTVFEPGFAKLIPKGAQIVFQMHYTPNGTATTDRSSLGLIYADREPEYVVDTYALGTLDFLLKAGDANYRKSTTLTMKNDVALSSLMPHLHVRGTSFQYRAKFPDGRNEVLLSVPKWDFNWQHEYKLVEPVMLKKGTQLTVEATWDNSENNPNNFFPLVDVHFGEQTFDEMFIGYVNYVLPIAQFHELNGTTAGGRKKSRYTN